MMVRASFITKIILTILVVKVRYESEKWVFRVVYTEMCDRIITWAKENREDKMKNTLKIVVH